ncbi:MAG: hypothetical protein HQL31_10450, partial [Planctomycetes bacterium]|nr:hypothetical protein [Planctomycetota bacterium]
MSKEAKTIRWEDAFGAPAEPVAPARVISWEEAFTPAAAPPSPASRPIPPAMAPAKVSAAPIELEIADLAPLEKVSAAPIELEIADLAPREIDQPLEEPFHSEPLELAEGDLAESHLSDSPPPLDAPSEALSEQAPPSAFLRPDDETEDLMESLHGPEEEEDESFALPELSDDPLIDSVSSYPDEDFAIPAISESADDSALEADMDSDLDLDQPTE